VTSAPGCDPRTLERAVRVLARGGLVAFPTETVWGIAACAASDRAVSRLRAFKGHSTGSDPGSDPASSSGGGPGPSPGSDQNPGTGAGKDPAGHKPIAVLVSGLAELEALAVELSPRARALAERFWPGPLTLIVRASLALAPGVAGPGGAVGSRCSARPVAMELARAAGRAGLGPLTATSLNASGRPPANTRTAAAAVLAARGGIDAMTAGEAYGLAPSTVVDATTDAPRLVRAGAIPGDALGIEG